MPIRMVDDPQDQEEQRSNDDNGGGGGNFPVGPGGGGGLFNLLPLLLGMFRGKGIIFLLIIGGLLYFMMGRGGCNMGGGGGITDIISQFTRGGELNRDTFDKAKIFEGLDDYKNPLPEAANLQRFAPAVGNQGQQGSCVAWSSAYAAHTILESAKTAQNPDQLKFSPAFLYNNIKLEGCQGSYVLRAMEFMSKQGAVPYNDFQYRDDDCDRQPPAQLYDEAKQYRIAGFNRLTRGDNTEAIDLNAIRANLAQGAPVVIGMMVGQSFMQSMMGQDVWVPAAGDRNMMGFGGHAMCVVGYDDKKYGGAFLIMNSWGAEWGNNGFAWVRYPDFKYFVREAYGLEPMHKENEAYSPFECEVGLVEVQYDGKKTVPSGYIELRNSGSNLFETASPIKIGSRFKIKDIDSKRMQIFIERAKGKKDRYVNLSPVLLDILRNYIKTYKPKPRVYLFESEQTLSAYPTRTVQQIFYTAKSKARILKDAGIHSLRHSFATHLLEKGTDIKYIKDLLGHFDIKTTERCLHVSRRNLVNIISPLDDLMTKERIDW